MSFVRSSPVHHCDAGPSTLATSNFDAKPQGKTPHLATSMQAANDRLQAAIGALGFDHALHLRDALNRAG